MSAFSISQHVWFKVAGGTPFVKGVAADPATESGSLLGGRGKAAISKNAPAKSGLSDAQGVPTIDFSAFPAVKESTDTASGTNPSGGEHLGVRDQVTDNNPLAPGGVATDGVFDGPTTVKLSGLAADEGDVSASVDTIRDIDPNRLSGSTQAAVAGGASTPMSGDQDFVTETIDLKSHTVGLRTPSSQEGAGVVIERVIVKNAGVTPDGTKVAVGDELYWVDWGSNAVSNPHRSKLNNKMRTSLHAAVDLVAA